MINRKSLTLFLTTGIVFLLTIYFCLAFWYVSAAKDRDMRQVRNHAVIIAHDLWTLNSSGMYAYLDLVAKTDHYSTLDVLNDDSEQFLHIVGPEKGVIDTILYRLGCIPKEFTSSSIFYDGEEIGSLQGERYVRYVYPLTYIFLVLFFTFLTLAFITYLIFNRRLLEQQVQERTQRYQELVNLLPEMVIETDAEGIITFANEKAMQGCGFSDFVENRFHCGDYIRFENGERGDFDMFLEFAGKDRGSNEYRLRSDTASPLPVLVRSAPIYRSGRFVGARMVIVDIAERKALEEQLSRDQKMKSIGMMASGIAHDLNNILSGIINYPELLLQQVPPESPLIKLIHPMKKAGLRAAAVVADLLTVARGVAAAKEPADINDIVQEYLDSPEFDKLRSENPNIRYEILPSKKLNHVICSSIHVRKSLMNLINNASEAIDGTGQVTIETADAVIDTPIPTDYGVIAPGSYVTLCVKDTGEGMPPHVQSHIFEPFYSKKELGRSGTGLGLAVVWNTMEDHNGGIRVVSTENGSMFELYFPGSVEKAERRTAETTIDAFMGKGESILIVDDELQQRDIASRLLESLGYEVVSVASGAAAAEYVRTKKVDLVLLDMIMDEGMNGHKTYEELIKIHPGQKAIIISGYSESDDVRNTLRIGAGGLINKPYTREQLAMAVFEELSKEEAGKTAA